MILQFLHHRLSPFLWLKLCFGNMLFLFHGIYRQQFWPFVLLFVLCRIGLDRILLLKFCNGAAANIRVYPRIPPYTFRIPPVYHRYTLRIPPSYLPYTFRIPSVYPPYTPYTSRIPLVYPPYTPVYRVYPPYTSRILLQGLNMTICKSHLNIWLFPFRM